MPKLRKFFHAMIMFLALSLGGQTMEKNHTEIATFAGGCFWGVEHYFQQIPGVLSAQSGYTGGAVPNPSYEQVGSGNNGTLTNGPTKTIGKIGQGLSFAYDDDNYISVADVPSLQNIAQKTICAWIYPRSTGSSANDATIVSKSESSSSYGWYLQLADDSVANAVYFLQAFSGGSALWVTPANSIVLNTWQHVCVTYDDSSASNNPTIYINAASQSLSGGGASGSVRSDVGYILDIGNRSTSPSNGSFDGVIDDVRIYNRILSSTEISSLYNMGR
jgi:hypothetical protein